MIAGCRTRVFLERARTHGGSGRKVRAPKGRVPGNAREEQSYGECNRKHTAVLAQASGGKGEKAG